MNKTELEDKIRRLAHTLSLRITILVEEHTFGNHTYLCAVIDDKNILFIEEPISQTIADTLKIVKKHETSIDDVVVFDELKDSSYICGKTGNGNMSIDDSIYYLISLI